MSDSDYEVGYGKPPREHRFKPGNKAARKRGKGKKRTLSMAEVLDAALQTRRKIRRGDRVISMTAGEILVERLVQGITTGSLREVAQIMQILERHAPDLLASEPQKLEIELHRSEGSQVELPSSELWDDSK